MHLIYFYIWLYLRAPPRTFPNAGRTGSRASSSAGPFRALGCFGPLIFTPRWEGARARKSECLFAIDKVEGP